MTKFQKYRNKETGEIIEVEELDYIQGMNDTGLKQPLRIITTEILNYDGFGGMANPRVILIELEDFNNNYELIKDND